MCFCCKFLKNSKNFNKTVCFCILKQKEVSVTDNCNLFEDIDSDVLNNIE